MSQKLYAFHKKPKTMLKKVSELSEQGSRMHAPEIDWHPKIRPFPTPIVQTVLDHLTQ